MSILPEFIIQQAIVRGFRAFRENPNLIDPLFRNLPQSDIDNLRQFIQSGKIDIAVNYPDQAISLPAIIILLKNETESQAFLGELMESAGEVAFLGDGTFTVDEISGDQTTLGSGSTTNTSQTVYTILQPTAATGGVSNEIWAAPTVSRIFDPFEEECYVSIIEGMGAGQKRKLVSVIPEEYKTIFEVDSDWTIVPNATSIFKIIRLEDNLTGEPSKIFRSSDKRERLGQIYRANYQLNVYGPNQETVIYLYIILKAIMIVFREFLARNGVLRGIRMTGSDLAPETGYFPQLAYLRSLTLEFEYSFGVYSELTEAVAETISIYISATTPTTTEEEREIVSIETSLDIT